MMYNENKVLYIAWDNINYLHLQFGGNFLIGKQQR